MSSVNPMYSVSIVPGLIFGLILLAANRYNVLKD